MPHASQRRYPTINFIGNKEKITDWICQNIPSDVQTVLDAFSGGASVSYALKARGKTVYANDIMKVNNYIAQAIIENSSQQLSEEDVQSIFAGKPTKGFVYKTYANSIFFAEECMQLDLYRKNIMALKGKHKRALAFTLMRRAMIRKMPYSRFNIKWDKVAQLRDEEYSYAKYGRRRAYHNQSFEYHFRANLERYNAAIFDNGQQNKAYNQDIFKLIHTVSADLIYLDPPYAGTMNNYHDFYSFLDSYIEDKVVLPFKNNFIDRNESLALFNKLFASLSAYKYVMLSYNSSSYPAKEELVAIIGNYRKNVKVLEMKHDYKLTGKVNKSKNTEYLFIAGPEF